MIGMAIAVATTLAAHPPADGIGWLLVILGVARWQHRQSSRAGDDFDAELRRRFTAGRQPRCWSPPCHAPEAFDIGTPGHIHGAA
jgi:NAD(P) transhydrogenase subunit beta